VRVLECGCWCTAPHATTGYMWLPGVVGAVNASTLRSSKDLRRSEAVKKASATRQVRHERPSGTSEPKSLRSSMKSGNGGKRIWIRQQARKMRVRCPIACQFILREEAARTMPLLGMKPPALR